MPKKGKNPGSDEVKSYPKGIGFCSVGADANSSVIDVKDGKIIRIKPLHFDWKYRPEEFNPWKIEARGQEFEPTMKSLIPPYSLAYRKRVYSPNRILYPLKRVDWDPDGERHPENRGKSGYVRISWDEALDIVIKEIKRIQKQYTSYAILAQADGHGETRVVHAPHGCQRRLLDLLGGYSLQIRNTDSWEGWYWGAKHVWGMEPLGQMGPVNNVIPDVMQNGEMVLFWGCDPETTPWGFDGQMASRVCYWFNDLGIKSIYVCPDLNYGAAVHADKWIPILPNTDAALHLAIAYTWITQGTYDKAYVATHTFGFDKFVEYVTGKEDGVAKTPEWAAAKTGVPSRIIKALARTWASRRTSVTHGNGGSMIRGPYSTEPGRLEILLLAMQGIGKPGRHWFKMIEWGLFGNPAQYPMPMAIELPDVMAACRGQAASSMRAVQKGLIPKGLLPELDWPKQIIPKTLVPDAILNPPLKWYGTSSAREPLEDQFKQYQYPVEGLPEAHMIWSDSPSWTTCWNNGFKLGTAFRSPKIEFVLLQHPWMENDCLYADIILPSNTKFEQELDIAADTANGQFHTVLLEEKCIEPIGESKSDYEIVCLIAERLGLLEEFTVGRTPEEWVRLGFDTSGIAKMISYDQLKEKQYFVVPTDPQWKKYKVGLKDFYDKPEEHPLKTPSGKIEFYSQNLAKHFPGDKERPPVPHWIERGESHDERLSSERAQKYPLLIVSNHGRWRVHSQHDDISWIREIHTCKVTGPDGYGYEPIWINPLDAAKRGIQSGDVVKVYNERGGVLVGAYVTERIMPGVVYVDHGARYDPIVPEELDRGGAVNTISPSKITSKNVAGMATSGFLVNAERVDLDDLRKRYPEVFNVNFDRAAGQQFERILARP
ncbi:MAG: molybdopterin oxidoreductase [Chloroflexi bacterium]|nr:molybdopterin oxidoreductase [Chloroflexota bacterium]